MSLKKDREMSEVPSVNEPKAEVVDSVSEGVPWVDPVFLEKNPERLPDEPEPTPEQIEARAAEEAEAAETERKENGQPTKSELAAMIAELPDDDEEKPAEEAKADPEGEEPDKDAEEADAKAKAEQADENDDDAEEAKDGKKPRKRSRARRERRAMEREMAAKDAEIERLRSNPVAPQPEAEQATPQPTLEDFEYDTDKWAAAMGEWTTGQIDAGKQQAAKAEDAKQYEAARQAYRETVEAHEERAEDMRDLHDDYDAVTRHKDLKVTDEMFAVILESEVGPQMAYHLGKHPEEAARISGLSPLAQAKALGRIETRLEAEQATAEVAENTETDDEPEEGKDAEEADPNSQPAAAKAPRRTPTKAPEPISTVGGGGSSVKRDPSRMAMDEFAEGRRTGKIK